MKKIIATLLCVAMLVTATSLFAACGNEVYIKGDFSKEASESEVDALASKLLLPSGDVIISYGDDTAEDWSFNVRAVDKAEMDLDMGINMDGQDITVKAKANADQDYIYGMRSSGGEKLLNGSGKIKSNAKTTVSNASIGESMSVDAVVNASAYNDGGTFYVDGKLSANSGSASDVIDYSGKFKISMAELFGDSYIVQSYATVSSLQETLEGSVGVAASLLKTTGCKVYIDESTDETKIKIDMDGKTFMENIGVGDIAGDAVGDLGDEVYGQMVDNIEVSRASIYLSFNRKTNAFTGFGLDAKISIKDFTMGSVDDGAAITANIELNMSQWMLFTTDQVTVPADLSAYQDFQA